MLLRGRGDRLEIEASAALDEKHTVGRLVTRRRMAVVAAGLKEVGPGAEPELGFPFRGLDVGPRYDHDLHVVAVRVERSRESRRQPEESTVRAVRMVAPQVRNLDPRGTGV